MPLPADVLPRDPVDNFTPDEIARNDLLTTREKLDLLYRLKAELTGEHVNPQGLAFGIGDIDRAIDGLRHRVREGTEETLRLNR
jgi:hypothetical protein